MKAKEWAAKLAESAETREETLKAFVEEIGTIAKQRGGSVSALEGAVREQRLKWQAVCRECPDLNPGQFEELLTAHGADFKKAEEMAKSQAARGHDDREGRGGYGRRGGGGGGGRKGGGGRGRPG